ncbi:MAG: DUF4492 domain-containing protein [Prevotella sp.]
MMKRNILFRIYDFYADGFKSMTIGKTLWAIIIIKLLIIFAILRIFFFPDFLKANAGKGGEPEFVATELIERSQ